MLLHKYILYGFCRRKYSVSVKCHLRVDTIVYILKLRTSFPKLLSRENIFRKIYNIGRSTKVNSVEFAVFEPTFSENLFRENFYFRNFAP